MRGMGMKIKKKTTKPKRAKALRAGFNSVISSSGSAYCFPSRRIMADHSHQPDQRKPNRNSTPTMRGRSHFNFPPNRLYMR